MRFAPEMILHDTKCEQVIGVRRDARIVIASPPLSADQNAPVFLKITVRGPKVDFYCGARAGEWALLLADADGTILSTRVAGEFVGTVIGLYAFSPAP